MTQVSRDGITVCVTPRVTMFTSPNPSAKTLDGTHNFLVGRDCAYVIDPGPLIPSHLDALRRAIIDSETHVLGILLTHAHPDHAPGGRELGRLLGVPVWAAEATGTSEARACGVTLRYGNNQSFAVDGDRLAVVPTPGHTRDHVAFWLERARLLFSGDVVLGHGTTLIAPPDGDMIDYMFSLRTIGNLHAERILPGHGPIIDQPDRIINEYIAHRERREREVLAVLANSPSTVQQLVEEIYHEVGPELKPLAYGSLRAQLAKLATEGHVREDNGTFYKHDN